MSNQQRSNCAAPKLEARSPDPALLRSMVDNAADGIVAIDTQGRILMANRAAERLFGYHDVELRGQNVKLLMPEPFRSEHDRYLRNYLETGKPTIIGIGREVRGRRRDGSTFPMYLSVAEVHCAEQRLFTGIVHDLTELKAAEAKIAQLQRQHERILNAIGEGILGVDSDWHISFANPAAAGMLGCECDELTGRSLDDIWCCARTVELARRAMENAEPYQTDDASLQRRNGDRFPVDLVSTPIRGEGAGTGAVISFQDITERREAEARLRRERDRMQTYLDIAGVMIVAIDAEQRVTLVNRKGCEILGYRAPEIIGKHWFDHFVPETVRAELRDLFRKMLSGDERAAQYHENPVLTRGREERIVAWHNVLLTDEVGKIVGTLSSGEDITERRRASQELLRMRSYLKNIIDSMPSILVGVDMQGRVTEWNQGAERATGVPTAQAVGRNFTELFTHLADQIEKVREAIRLGRPVRSDRLVTEQDGEIQYSDVVVFPLIANGTHGAVIRVEDITKRVRIEQMMVQTEKMMSVGGLAAGMAHEINNPLSAILQGCQNALRRLSPDLAANRRSAERLGLDLERLQAYLEQRGIGDFLQGIQESANRAGRIVQDMLSFSRRSDTRFERAHVVEMLETVVRLAANDYDLKKKYDFRQIHIERDYDPDVGEIECDRTEIEQVFLNVIKNAAQAMADSGMQQPHRIWLRTRRSGRMARVEVEDNGPGMAPEVRRRVFEPFFTTKSVGVGTGLGLSVSYFIITEQHHGSISVRSTPGNGTCFVVQLPRQESPQR
jgi:PAS domain S-box-containing protein